MNIKERLDLVIKDLGISGRMFSKACGFSESYFSSINDGIGADKLNKILSAYPNISARWLITGEGQMHEENNIQSNDTTEKKCIAEEKFFDYVKDHDSMHEAIISQNSEILRQNSEVLKRVLSIFDK